MTDAASYILSAYSFISTLSLEQLLNFGNRSKNGNPIPSFDENVLISLCNEARQIFMNEDNSLRIEGDVIVVGDIHGSFHDLLRILKFIEKKQSKVLFLGDYVDRGQFSLECITILFAMKILQPDNFFLIRGNHEFDSLCSQYGFKKEIINHHKSIVITKTTDPSENSNKSNNTELQVTDQSKNLDTNFYEYSIALYDAFLNTFSYLPICAIVNNTTFCIHGGLSPLLEKVDMIKTCIKRPINTYEENILLADVVWSDPSSNHLSLFRSNQRGRGFLFNMNSVINFLSSNSLERIIRAHQCVKNGIFEQFNKMCITVFSASSYAFNMENHSGILQITQKDDSVQYMMFPPLLRLKKSEAAYYKVQEFNPNKSQKSMYFTMRHPQLVFRGKTPKTKKTENKCPIDKSKNDTKPRDFNCLKLHCHVNPASIVNLRKNNFPFVHIHKISDSSSLSNINTSRRNIRGRSVKAFASLPTKLTIEESLINEIGDPDNPDNNSTISENNGNTDTNTKDGKDDFTVPPNVVYGDTLIHHNNSITFD